MVVEVVGTVSGAQRFRRVQRRLAVVLAGLTVVMVVLWPNQAAPRSVASFVVTCLWSLAAIALSSMMIAWPDEESDDDDTGEGSL